MEKIKKYKMGFFSKKPFRGTFAKIAKLQQPPVTPQAIWDAYYICGNLRIITQVHNEVRIIKKAIKKRDNLSVA